MSEMATQQLCPDGLEEELIVHCPICGKTDFGSLQNHLQAHSKQALIDALVNKRDPLGCQAVKPVSSNVNAVDIFGNEDGDRSMGHAHGHSGRRSASPPKKSTSRGASHSRRRSTAAVRDSRHGFSATSQEPSTSRVAIESIAGNDHGGTLVYEVEIENLAVQNLDPETTEIMPVPICSFSVPPVNTRTDPNPNLMRMHFLCPVTDADQEASRESEIPKSNLSHSNFIKYIIDETRSGNRPTTKREEPTKWILPGGMTIPVYSSFTNIPSSSRNSQESLRSSRPTHDESSSSLSNFNDRQHSSMHQSDVDLMTDEEIPPRGEISEYEESNTSSHQSDELNKPGVISIGSSLGSLFSDVRRLSPGIELDSNGSPSRRKPSPALKATVPSELPTKSTNIGSHKCPDPDCSQVGSIFELAQHQEKAHHKILYNKVVRKTTPPETSSQSMLMSKATPQRDTKPLISVPQDRGYQHPVPSTPKDYRCVYCDFFTKKKKVIDTHMEMTHPDKPAVPTEFECSTCGKMFQKRTNLIKHLLIHGGKRHRCSLCSKAFTSKFKLGEHVRVHTKDYPFPCSECERSFRTPSLRKAHMVRCHPKPGDVKPVVAKLELYCTICHRVLHSKRSLTSHLKLHAETSTKKCPFCPELFPRNSVLVRHIRSSHDPMYESKESQDCPVCAKKLHPNSMRSHMRIHNNERPFPCTVCSKTFRTYANLLSHSWNHTNADKPYKCTLCSKSYLFNKSLETHMIVHKKRTFHFVCNVCGRKFTTKVNMKRHLEEHYSEKKHKCRICFKTFHRKYYLTEHERIHNGTKPFTCSICGKASSTKSNHRAHVKIHDARESGSLEN